MKNLFVLSIIGATALVSCNSENKETTSTTVNSDTTENAAAATTTYAPAEGDVSYRNGRVMIWRNNEWVETDEDVTLNDGIVVKRNGEVKKGDDIVKLEEGESVDKSGRFFYEACNAIEDAWDATKKGVKKAGEEVKDVFTDDDKKNN
jgi:hypothetical protein